MGTYKLTFNYIRSGCIFLFLIMMSYPAWASLDSNNEGIRAVITEFTAYKNNGHAVVQWETENEYGTIGYYLYRLNVETNELVLVHDNMLPSVVLGTMGGEYRFADEAAKPHQTYTYHVEEVKAWGGTFDNGPYTVTVEKEYAASVSDSFAAVKFEQQPKKSETKTVKTTEASLHNRLKGDTAKIVTTENGLYFISAEQLSECLAFSVTAIDEMIKTGNIHLSNNGKEVAWMPSVENGGIYFYAEKLAEKKYTDNNIYWVTKKKGTQMALVENPGELSILENQQSFTKTIHVEKDMWPATAIFDDPDSDYWLWEFVYAGYPGWHTRTFNFQAPDVSDEPVLCELKVHLKGASIAGIGLDHHAQIYLNGEHIVSGQWDRMNSKTIPKEFEQSKLFSGENTLTITGIKNSGVPYSIFYLDGFDITYRRLFVAVDDQLSFKGSGESDFLVTGFTSSEIMVFDITNPKQADLIADAIVEPGSDGYDVSFKTDNPGGNFLAIAAGRAASPKQIITDIPSDLKNHTNQAQYIIITPEELLTGARRLADYRNEYETMVVLLEDIYDEFNHGIESPFAICAFIKNAYNEWKTPPQFVVLAGEGTYDYKDILGFGDNILPAIMVNTPYGLFPADNRFVDVEGDDGLPEIAIGRLPVVSESELNKLIDKIAIFESGIQNLQPWNTRVVMVADNPDSAGNFPYDSDEIAQIISPWYTVDKIYLGQLSLYTSRTRFKSAFNDGSFIINYIGHSLMDKFAHEGMFKTSDVYGLTNTQKLPIVIAMTCLAGNFSTPGYDTLTEAMLLHDGGAVAVWTATGLSLNSQGRVLDSEFFESVFTYQKDTLGEAVLDALTQYNQQGGMEFILDIYHILGDPALRIQQ